MINPRKGTLNTDKHNDHIADMEHEVTEFFGLLASSSKDFDAGKVFDKLLEYVQRHNRMLYSTISNIIYAYNESDELEQLGIVMSNLEKLLEYSESTEEISKKKQSLREGQTADLVDTTRKIVIKIWDHVSLATHQYNILKQTDTEYTEKFKERISGFKEEMTKDMNGQLLTMVSIFTALAFLIFGSISSLDGIFENNNIPIFKTMSIGIIWGMCVTNMIFVFLFCIGKMTKLTFSSSRSDNCSIFQKYPVIWWTNGILFSLLLITGWLYFIQCYQVNAWIKEFCNRNTLLCLIGGSLVVVGAVVVIFVTLCKCTNRNKKIVD